MPPRAYVRASALTAAAGLAAALAAAAMPAAIGADAPTAAGATWTAVTAPLPAGVTATGVEIDGVACPAARTCTAVGQYSSATGSGGLLLTGHGTSWTAVAAPVPAGAAGDPGIELDGVACPSPAVCVAAGSYTESSGRTRPMLVTGHGPAWTVVRPPNPAGPSSQADGWYAGPVVCPSVTECVIPVRYSVPAPHHGSHHYAFLLTGHGSSWTAARPPLPAGAAPYPEARFPGVACPAATGCVVSGSYADSSGNSQGLLLTQHRPSWTAAKAPLPADAGAGFPNASVDDVACPAVSACTAVGSYDDSSIISHGLLLTRHGPAWTAASAPLPADAPAHAVANLTSVACSSAVTCVAAGHYNRPAKTGHGLLLTRHGPAWTAATAPLPPGVPASADASLDQVACSSATTCAAFGWYDGSPAALLGLLLTRHGSAWTAASAPLPPGVPASTDVFLDQMACSSATTCVVIGWYDNFEHHLEGGLLLTGRL